MAIFRPDAHPETSSVDGWAGAHITFPGGTWAALKAHPGGVGSDSGTTAYVKIRSTSTTDRWFELARGVVLFDTSTLPDDVAISATLSLRGLAKRDDFGMTPDINVYACNPASNTEILPADFTTFGSTPFSTTISYASWDINGWNDFVLNASGLAVINKTGITKLGLRNVNGDVNNSEPTWRSFDESGLTWWTADRSEEDAPKLTVTYTTSVMTAGNFAVVETRLHYVGTDSVERYIFGPIIGDAVNAPGNVAVVEDRLHYVGASYTKERYCLGIEIGAASNADGNIAVVENRLQYTAGSKERYVKGIPV